MWLPPSRGLKVRVRLQALDEVSPGREVSERHEIDSDVSLAAHGLERSEELHAVLLVDGDHLLGI